MTNEAPHQSLRHCPSCGTAIQAEWTFCGLCGGALPTLVAERVNDATLDDEWATEGQGAEIVSLPTIAGAPANLADSEGQLDGDDDPVAIATGKRARFRMTRKRALTAGACLVAACLLSLGVFAYASTRSDLSDTRHKLKSTSATLASTQGKLEQTLSKLSHTEDNLSSTTRKRDQLQKSLNDANAKLAGVQTSLTDAKTRLNLQAGQIETLKSCLNGVSIALSDSAYGDYTGAISALDAVQVSCNAASKLL